MQTLDALRKQKVVAIVRLPDLSQAEPLAAALIAGGIGALEFTLTNPDAAKTIAALRKLFKDETAVIGAGSVLTVDQAQACMDAGSEFIVMPVTKPDVIAACVARGIPVMPGAYTPTEIQKAWELGASVAPACAVDAYGRCRPDQHPRILERWRVWRGRRLVAYEQDDHR
jgi:2-dehydro-3-deoxyphosphogluconate aldolase / (4S)-4-hydroxy-2-oxoglutarate aldolase